MKQFLKIVVLIAFILIVFVSAINRYFPKHFELLILSESSQVAYNHLLPGSPPAGAEVIDNKVLDSAVFDNIYKKNLWGGGSGPGSFAANTVEYRAMLQKIFDDDRYQSFVDLGCGDFQMMKLMKLPPKKSYVGIDVVADVIKENERLYGGSQNPNYKFHHVQHLGALNQELL